MTIWIIIPIMALLIPIVAIIFNSPIGRSLANYLDVKSQGIDPGRVIELERDVEELFLRLSEVEEDNHKLVEKYTFLERLLESPDESKK